MPSNRIIIASAGAGKTTEIITQALAMRPKKCAIITFTLNNVEEIKSKFFEVNGCIPPEVRIYPWFSFMLYETIRPYQGVVHTQRISSVHLLNGTSPIAKKTDIKKYYFNKSNEVYSDKLGAFALLCEEKTNGLVIKRLNDMFDHIFIDELQDLAGHDIDVIEKLLASPIHLTLVGDIRQSTFRTNYSKKNKAFIGRGLLAKIAAWEKSGFCKLEYKAESRRCIQSICDLADSIFPDLPKAKSLNDHTTDHDGIFIVRSTDIVAYVERFNPQVLRRTKVVKSDFPAINFGVSKGLGFNRILIQPYGGITKWLTTGDSSHVKGSADEVYVAITRARQSVALVHDGVHKIANVTVFDPAL